MIIFQQDNRENLLFLPNKRAPRMEGAEQIVERHDILAVIHLGVRVRLAATNLKMCVVKVMREAS